MINLTLKGYIAQKAPNMGERVWALYDDRDLGFPMFYPTAYVTWNLRSEASSTVKTGLYAIKKLYEWSDSAGIDIEERFESRVFFETHEIVSMSDYLSRNHNRSEGAAIGSLAHAAVLRVAAKFLRWHAGDIIKNSNTETIKSSIDHMYNSITSRIPSPPSKTRRNQKARNKRLKEPQRAALDKLYENPISETMKPSGVGVRYRLIVLLRIIDETGCRKSEALGLELGNFTRALGGSPAQLSFIRTHDSGTDHRLNEPVLKTEERDYPISDETAKMIETYLSDYRAFVPGANFASTAPIFITHIAGSNQGKGLQLSAFDSDLARLKEKVKKLAGLHFHLLRYDWNYRFSTEAKTRGLTQQQEEKERRYLMGWSLTSEMANIYNLRHTIESAHVTASKTWLTNRPKKA